MKDPKSCDVVNDNEKQYINQEFIGSCDLYIPVLKIIELSRNKLSFINKDYEKYKKYCSSRMEMYRKKLNFPVENLKNSLKNYKINSERKAKLLILIFLFKTETVFSSYYVLKHPKNKKENGKNKVLDRLLLRKLHKAIRHTSYLRELCKAYCNKETQLEVELYYQYLLSRIYYEKKNWADLVKCYLSLINKYNNLYYIQKTFIERELIMGKITKLNSEISYANYLSRRETNCQTLFQEISEKEPESSIESIIIRGVKSNIPQDLLNKCNVKSIQRRENIDVNIFDSFKAVEKYFEPQFQVINEAKQALHDFCIDKIDTQVSIVGVLGTFLQDAEMLSRLEVMVIATLLSYNYLLKGELNKSIDFKLSVMFFYCNTMQTCLEVIDSILDSGNSLRWSPFNTHTLKTQVDIWKYVSSLAMAYVKCLYLTGNKQLFESLSVFKYSKTFLDKVKDYSSSNFFVEDIMFQNLNKHFETLRTLVLEFEPIVSITVLTPVLKLKTASEFDSLNQQESSLKAIINKFCHFAVSKSSVPLEPINVDMVQALKQ